MNHNLNDEDILERFSNVLEHLDKDMQAALERHAGQELVIRKALMELAKDLACNHGISLEDFGLMTAFSAISAISAARFKYDLQNRSN